MLPRHDPHARRVRAVGLLSGGLDSALSAALLMEQGIDVVGLHFESPASCRGDARGVARDLGVPLTVRPKGEEFLKLLREPRWGYGRNMNPCLDCRIFMLRAARGFMDECEAQFIFTGEVPGQRAMSQLRDRIRLIDRESGLEGLILRPLSARLLPETVPERRGWVERARLLGISGRSRREQLAQAARLGLRRYQSPGGGCLLTEAVFSRKLHDLFAHAPEGGLESADVALLAVGRHFRLGPGLKVVLGRNAGENARLPEFRSERRWLVEPEGFAGPSALVWGPRDETGLERAIQLITRYARSHAPQDRIRWRAADGVHVRTLREVPPFDAPPAAL